MRKNDPHAMIITFGESVELLNVMVFRLVDRVNLLEKAMDEVHEKCDVVIARLDTIRVVLPSNYAEEHIEDDS